jgi:hypothetical protein
MTGGIAMDIMESIEATTEPEVEVVELTRGEWDKLCEAELARLGLTYEELKEQARMEDFACEDARRVWFAIGGLYGPDLRSHTPAAVSGYR